jgi:fructokinase
VTLPTLRIGIDLGGTKIEALALASDGTELARRRVATPSHYDHTLGLLRGLVSALEGDSAAKIGAPQRAEVGVGIPGTLSPTTGLVKNANSAWLNGRPFDQDLGRVLGRPIRVANDANCFVLSEATDGAGAGADTVFGIIIGTGVGGGTVVHGRVLEGRQRIGGEWGHNPLPWPKDSERPGPECVCGKRGCLETFVSGPGFASDHEFVTGVTLSTHEIAEQVADGQPDACATYERYVDRLARGLATVVNVLDPDVVVLGGGMSNLPDLPDDVEHALPPFVFTNDCSTRVVRNVHGDASGVRGAAWLWPGEHDPRT